MASKIITNIKQLVNVREQTHVLRGEELAQLPVIENAYLIIEDGIIAEYGEMKDLPNSYLSTVNCQLSTVDLEFRIHRTSCFLFNISKFICSSYCQA